VKTKLACVLVLAVSAGTAPASADSVDDCIAAWRQTTRWLLQLGFERDQARFYLEFFAARCQSPGEPLATSWLVGRVNWDRARFARDFATGALTVEQYAASIVDRRRKLAAMRADPDAQAALVRGDADLDLVPDKTDSCPGTPSWHPTDSRGCPTTVPRRPGAAREERRLRRGLATARVLYNPSCDGAPKPPTPTPLAWGRGMQTKLGTQGFNLAVAKVTGMPPGCEIFYEIEFRFIDPNLGDPTLPPSKNVGVVFVESEDLLTEPTHAVFGLPLGQALSPGRTSARQAFFAQYLRVTWRVRAVTGSAQASPWSAPVTQGPAPGGVDG
jgi:hypothetical protein